MKWRWKKKRPALEVIGNVPVEVIVGPRGNPKKQVTLQLREPTMYELLDFMENSVEKLVPVYSKKWAQKQVAKIAKSGKVDAGELRLIKPAFEPIGDFIALCADQPDLTGKLYKLFTAAQFTRCINILLYLVDVEELAVNFTQALNRVSAAQKATKQAS